MCDWKKIFGIFIPQYYATYFSFYFTIVNRMHLKVMLNLLTLLFLSIFFLVYILFWIIFTTVSFIFSLSFRLPVSEGSLIPHRFPLGHCVALHDLRGTGWPTPSRGHVGLCCWSWNPSWPVIYAAALYRPYLDRFQPWGRSSCSCFGASRAVYSSTNQMDSCWNFPSVGLDLWNSWCEVP